MKYHHLVLQTVQYHQEKKNRGKLKWWHLTLIGMGSIVGAGFFLGNGVAINLAGPSVLIAYLVGGLLSYLSFAALAEMSVNDPNPGSFRHYTRKALGRGVGFVCGWMYWIGGVFTMSSEITALSVFTKYWFPHVPLWVFSIIYSVLALAINITGAKNFGKAESIFGIIKITTLISFIFFGVLVFLKIIPVLPPAGQTASHNIFSFHRLFPNGFSGMWSALLFVLFSFGGIGVIGFAANELENQEDLYKASTILVLALTVIYFLSIVFVFYFVAWDSITGAQSPFVTALSSFHIPYFSSLFNLIIITAAFSTMVGALYSIAYVLVSLAKDGQAPPSLAKLNKKGVPVKSLAVSCTGLAIAVVLSFLLPNSVFELVTTAAGIMMILNWVFVFAAQIKNRPAYEKSLGKLKFKMFAYPFSSYLGIGMVFFAIIGCIFNPHQRIGLIVTLLTIILISVGYLLASKLNLLGKKL
ncbi:amino acid permease [Thermincola ferriacetica]